MKVAIIGAGAWGTALAVVLSDRGHDVRLWARRPEFALELAKTRVNQVYLPGVPLPERIEITCELEDCLAGAQMVLIAVPSHSVREIARRIRAFLRPDQLLVNASKGLEAETGMRLSQVLAEELPEFASKLLVLSGPNHAEEVARMIPTAAVIAGENPETLVAAQDGLMCRQFRIYRNTDLIGVELAGSLKNVISLAAGISDGLGFGDNTKGALISRGLAEMIRLGCAMGANPLTFTGLAGLGDLVATATSRHSRNRWAGEQIGKGRDPQEILSSTPQVVEGAWAARAGVKLARHYGVELPITQKVFEVLYEGFDPREAVSELMSRDPKPEIG